MCMRNKILLVVCGFILVISSFAGGWFARDIAEFEFLSPLSPHQTISSVEKPLDRFSFDRLRLTQFAPNQIAFERVFGETPTYTGHLFTYTWEGKKISGLAHIPKKNGKLPVVIMLRGYVDKEEYQTGVGTARSGQILAENGFITLAPDFLGFGESDPGPLNDLEDRFNRPSQIVQLISSLQTVSQADPNKLFMWAHSNGGQIALSVLEITKRPIPTTLWAPVSKPFPYSVLYYTDEFSDGGKYLRRMIAEFESEYNADRFSISTFLPDIKAPLIIHQGGADDAVPQEWSDELVTLLKDLGVTVEYFTYPDADHNMKGSWDTVVARDVDFFKKFLN